MEPTSDRPRVTCWSQATALNYTTSKRVGAWRYRQERA